jgi:hypothetical protein
MAEFSINNIPFSWKFLGFAIMINLVFMVYNIYYSVETKQISYDEIDGKK